MRALVASVALTLSAPLSAQPATDDPPVSLPGAVVETYADGDAQTWVFDAPYETCVAHMRETFVAGDDIRPGVTVTGGAYILDRQAWSFSLRRDDGTLRHVFVSAEPRGCAVELAPGTGFELQAAHRWSFPPLRMADGTEITVDPFVIED